MTVLSFPRRARDRPGRDSPGREERAVSPGAQPGMQDTISRGGRQQPRTAEVVGCTPRSRWRTARPRRSACRLSRQLAAAMAVATGAAPRRPHPATSPAGPPAVLDSRALDELQQRAAEVQAGLQEQQGEVVAAREALTAAEQAVADAEAVALRRRGRSWPRYREVVASYASAVYRDGGALTPLTLLLSGGDPGDVLSAMGFLDAVDAHAAEVIGARRSSARPPWTSSSARARRSTRRGPGPTRWPPGWPSSRPRPPRSPTSSTPRWARSTAAVAAAAGTGRRERARRRPTGRPTSTSSPRPGSRRRRPRRCVNPAAGLPGRPGAGRRRAAGERSRGPPSCRGQPASLLVLPAETLTAVTAAMEALGLPYAPGHRRSGVVGLRLARPVGLRPGRDPAARDPGRPVRRDHAGRRGRRAAR